MKPTKRPQMWLEESEYEAGRTYTLIRIFYPDGTSEYLTMNTYHHNGNVLVDFASKWANSIGNDWFPESFYDKNEHPQTDATFLGYL